MATLNKAVLIALIALSVTPVPVAAYSGALSYYCVRWLAWVSASPDKSRLWFRYNDLNRRSIPGVVRIYIQAVASTLQYLTDPFVNAAFQAYHRGKMSKGGEGRRETV